MLTVEDRKLLRRGLYHGFCKETAEKLGVSRAALSQWFSGKTNSQNIEDAVFAAFIKRKEERERKLKEAGLL